MALNRIEKRLRMASLFTVAGIAVALISMFWNHPLTFMVFLFLGLTLCGVGMATYLLAIVSLPDRKGP